ncbi:hypothetical protein J2S03_000356 [Alicyclobacillus cycloheptanicus]|uniref:Uncharacterized protein n=1 Tax=Alicyclobacillus cycloheptanicus TaxID=1457 RepID=A0ABT9XEE2_9BACL|nr:hypothetical protein [Alicyclobacillus cycloheptanicus]
MYTSPPIRPRADGSSGRRPGGFGVWGQAAPHTGRFIAEWSKKKGGILKRIPQNVLLGVERNQNKTPFDKKNIPKWKRCQ